jgi:hypothetical protein
MENRTDSRKVGKAYEHKRTYAMWWKHCCGVVFNNCSAEPHGVSVSLSETVACEGLPFEILHDV